MPGPEPTVSGDAFPAFLHRGKDGLQPHLGTGTEQS